MRLSPCLFNFYTEYIMRNAGLEEAQAGIKIAGRNINILRYADDINRMAESEEELKSLLMKVKEESEKVGLNSTFRKLRSWHLVPSLHGKEMGTPDHLTCLLRNLYAGQEANVRTGHGTTDRLQIGKGVCQDCILLPCLLNLGAEHIMRNAGLEEAQAGVKTVGRSINNLRYA